MATQEPSGADDPLHNISAASSRRPHVVVVPFPAEGHLNPCLSLAHFLASSAISVTLVQAAHALTARSQHPISPTSLPSSPATSTSSGSNFKQGSHENELPPFRIEVIPGGFYRSKAFSIPLFKSALDLMRKHFSDLLHRLMLEENAPVCLLIDSFFPWGSACAGEFGLPLVLLYTSSASSFCLGLHVPDLAARNFIPATEEGAKDKVVDFVPGLSPFRVADMPRLLSGVEGLQSEGFLFFSSMFQHAKSADRILVNTFYELEASCLDALGKVDHVPIDPVGPLFMMSTAAAPARQLSNEKGESPLMAWLDQQQEASVLYIAFGSVATIQEEAFAELAQGLEASGQRFVWVIRPDAYEGKASAEEIVPGGFTERTRGRGQIIEWAPQLAVLGHGSVGAFLTHCGWNSVLESLSNGVPMLGFPQMAEQNTNLKLMVHDWKVGLPLLASASASAKKDQQRHGGGGKVEAEGVQRAIMAIMSGEEGAQVRMRALEWKQVATRQATTTTTTQEAATGSSKDNLQKLVHDLRYGLLSKS